MRRGRRGDGQRNRWARRRRCGQWGRGRFRRNVPASGSGGEEGGRGGSITGGGGTGGATGGISGGGGTGGATGGISGGGGTGGATGGISGGGGTGGSSGGDPPLRRLARLCRKPCAPRPRPARRSSLVSFLEVALYASSVWRLIAYPSSALQEPARHLPRLRAAPIRWRHTLARRSSEVT